MNRHLLASSVVAAAIIALLGDASSASAQGVPIQDTNIYTGPAGGTSTLGGPTPQGELSIVRERSFSTTPPVMTGSGVTLGATTATDGQFSESIYFRSGPVVSNTRNPETAFSVTFPAGITVIGVANSEAELDATHTTWGLAGLVPPVDYTSSSSGMEAGEGPTVTVNPDGTTTVSTVTNMNNSPFTDDFRVLIDYGTAFVDNVSMTVAVTTGDDVNVGATDGGRTGTPTSYTVIVPLTFFCFDTPGTCFIGGVCRPAGTINPANQCEACDATLTRIDWSDRPNGTPCDDGLFCTPTDTCTSGVCSGPARVCNDSRECTDMEVCDEVNDRCAFRLAFGCLIDDACIPSGTRNPMNRCEVCDPTISGQVFRWTPLGSACDGDMDGFCPGGTDTNMDGDCSDAGETTTPGDCLDTNPAVNPSRTEVCGNGLDDECDGLTDDADPDCSDTSLQDMDDDGFCPAGTDMNDDGDCLDAGEMTGPQDCNDTNAMVNPTVVEVPPLCADTVDNDCDVLIDALDPGCSGDFDDDDDDGFCESGIDGNGDGDCRDAGEDVGPFDCNDGNVAVNPAADEDCDNVIDDDCDTLVDTDDRLDCPVAPEDLDDDDDGFCESGTDGNGDGDCLDPGEPGTPGDCDDTDPTVNPGALEVCDNTVDDDCDGDIDAADDDCVSRTDMDGDGFCPMGRDNSDDGDCLDEGEGTADSDCDDTMATVNPDAAEDCDNDIDDDCDGDIDAADDDCLDENLTDMDGDGFCPNGVDMNADGDCLDEGESAAGSDCDDTDAAVSPDAAEVCDDGIDNDCDDDIDTDDSDCPSEGTVDADGDGFCAGGGTDTNDDGDCDDEGEGEGDADCDDSDDTVNPGADEVCDDGEDNDCDGDTDEDDSDCEAPDAGMPDMGRPDSGAPDAGGTVIPPGGPSGGAGCSATGTDGSLPGAVFVLVALGLVVAARRRRR